MMAANTMKIDDERPHRVKRASARRPSVKPARAARGPTLVVCEHSSDWAHRLRRLLDAAPVHSSTAEQGPLAEHAGHDVVVRIVETRSAPECLEALDRDPAAWVALELAAGNCEATLDLLVTLDARFPRVRTAVLAARSMREYRWLLHELGAVCVIGSPWQLATLVEIVRRQTATPPGQLDGTLDLTAEILEGLPWQSA